MGVTIQQLSVFLENREGRLDEVLNVLAGNDVNIVALSLADTSDYGMLRMIVSDPNKRAGSIERKWNHSDADRSCCPAGTACNGISE